MSIKVGVLAVGLAMASLAVPVFAHHSWTAEYDAKKPVTVKGVVSKVEWTNPHTHFYVDTTDTNGKVSDLELRDGQHAGPRTGRLVAQDAADWHGGDGRRLRRTHRGRTRHRDLVQGA